MNPTKDFSRIRVNSARYSLSVTGEVIDSAFAENDPSSVAVAASCELFRVDYVGYPPDGLPTFNVLISNEPSDPELVLRTVCARIEAAYDGLAGQSVLR